MGEYEKHNRMAREKLQVVRTAFEQGQHSVVGDLATKVVEQLVEVDAARENTHFGSHTERHRYSEDRYPKGINAAMKKVWFAYGDLGYDGVNGGRAKKAIENLDKILKFFEEKFGDRIEE
jgi:hypothetical protein